MGVGKNEQYDVTVIGGGAGGHTVALEAARRGFRVALIEKDRLGGTCINRGCIPTQCILHDVTGFFRFREFFHSQKGRGFTKANLAEVMGRKNQVVDLLMNGTEKTLLRQGVAIFRGEGTFLDTETVAIKGSESVIRSRSFVIATGALSVPDPPFDIDHRKIWDTNDAIDMDSVPMSIAVVGNGKRAMTFADIFHFMGCRVTLITHEDRVLSDQDHEISSRYRKVLREKNINLLTSQEVKGIQLGCDRRSIELVLEAKGKGVNSIRVAKVLVPGRRWANVEGLGLDKVGLSLRDGFIPVDENLRTFQHEIYAIGDVIGGKYAAHKAMREGLNVTQQMTGEEAEIINYDLIPICLYTTPEVASIGLTQEEAEKRGKDVELGYFSFSGGARAAVFGQIEGIIKVVANRKYGEVLGVHILGPQATELISLASLAMRNELSIHEIKEAVCAHPSFSENFLEAINDAATAMVGVK